MKIIGVIGIVFLLVIGTLVISAPAIAEFMAFRKFPPDQRAALKAQYRVWKTKKLTLPAEALEAKPFSKETLDASRRFYEVWGKLNKQAMDATDKEKSSKSDVATKEAQLAGLAPLVDAFEALVRRPDFDIQTLSRRGGVGDYDTLIPNFLIFQCTAKLLRLKAESQSRAGQHQDALETTVLIVRASHASRYDTLIGQLIGIAIGSIGTDAWKDAMRPCNDPQLLRQTLEEQNQLAKQLVFLSDLDLSINAVDHIGMLREVKRQGMTVDYQNLTGRELTAKNIEAQIAYLEQKVLPTLPKGSEQAEDVRKEIENYKTQAPAMGGQPYSMKGYLTKAGGWVAAPILFSISQPNVTEAHTRAEMARAKFDLLRLETARKLYTLEKGKAPASAAELVPAYLPELPTDRFAPKKAEYQEAGGTFYSIGPNGKDEKNTFSYDPTNGTTSAGDLALAR